MVGRLHTDICNVPTHLLPGIRMQVKLTKAKRKIYVHSKEADCTLVFKILEAQPFVKRIRPNNAYLIAHNTVLQAGAIAKNNMTRVELNIFTNAKGSHSLSIDNVILGPIPKRLLFVMLNNTEFTGSLTKNPFRFHHFNLYPTRAPGRARLFKCPRYEGTRCGALQPFKCTVQSCIDLELQLHSLSPIL